MAAFVLYYSAENLDGCGLHRRSRVQCRETVVAGASRTHNHAGNECGDLLREVGRLRGKRSIGEAVCSTGCGLLKSSAS